MIYKNEVSTLIDAMTGSDPIEVNLIATKLLTLKRVREANEDRVTAEDLARQLVEEAEREAERLDG